MNKREYYFINCPRCQTSTKYELNRNIPLIKKCVVCNNNVKNNRNEKESE